MGLLDSKETEDGGDRRDTGEKWDSQARKGTRERRGNWAPRAHRDLLEPKVKLVLPGRLA